MTRTTFWQWLQQFLPLVWDGKTVKLPGSVTFPDGSVQTTAVSGGGSGLSGGATPDLPYWTSPTTIGNTGAQWDAANSRLNLASGGLKFSDATTQATAGAALTATAPSGLGASAAVGTATTAAHADHVHAITSSNVTAALGYTPLAPGPEVIARNATGQSFANNTTAVVNFDTVEVDTDAGVTTGAAWHYTVPAGKGGTYFVSASLAWVAGTSVAFLCAMNLRLNGATARRLDFINCTTSAGSSLIQACGSALVRLSAGDIIDVVATQINGGALAKALEGNVIDNYIYIERVRV